MKLLWKPPFNPTILTTALEPSNFTNSILTTILGTSIVTTNIPTTAMETSTYTTMIPTTSTTIKTSIHTSNLPYTTETSRTTTPTSPPGIIVERGLIIISPSSRRKLMDNIDHRPENVSLSHIRSQCFIMNF